MPETKIGQFRIVAKIEGVSFLTLLFIAMPLKYMMGYPIATKVAGMAHGLLFMLFIYQLLEAMKDVPFSKKDAAMYFILSLIPFGSFYTEKLCTRKPIAA